MFNNWICFNLYVASMHQIISANYPVVQNNRVLVGHSFKEFYPSDWFSCVQSCYDEPECISYNYQRSGNYIGLCDLNDSGVEELCDRDKSLIYSSDFVFQQIREIEVHIPWFNFNFYCRKIGRLNCNEATKDLRKRRMWEDRKGVSLEPHHFERN